MKLCIISPTSELEAFASQSDGVHLTLIHLVERDEKYAEFYRRRSEMGDTIIMDNGTFEFGVPASPDRMMKAAEKIKAHVLVAPDFPNEPVEKTVTSTEDFCKMLRGTQYTAMGCPQSVMGDYQGWLRAVAEMTLIDEISHIGVSIIATPNAFGPMLGSSKDIELCRLMATFALKEAIRSQYLQLHGKKLHYLGGGHRVDLIQYYDIADSLDTSSPVWHGWNGIAYEHGFLPHGKLKLPVDFDACIAEQEEHQIKDIIQHNMAIIKKYAEVASERSHA